MHQGNTRLQIYRAELRDVGFYLTPPPKFERLFVEQYVRCNGKTIKQGSIPYKRVTPDPSAQERWTYREIKGRSFPYQVVIHAVEVSYHWNVEGIHDSRTGRQIGYRVTVRRPKMSLLPEKKESVLYFLSDAPRKESSHEV